jgi:hypothetical protein
MSRATELPSWAGGELSCHIRIVLETIYHYDASQDDEEEV